MMKKFAFVFICAAFICGGAFSAFAEYVPEGSQSTPYWDYDFETMVWPSSDSSMAEDEAAQEDIAPTGEANPDNFDFQPLTVSECNSCAGASFTESFAKLPENMRGYWAFPDCSEPDDVVIQSQYFSIWDGAGQTLCMEPVLEVKDLGFFTSVTMTSGKTYVEITNDGLMLTGIPKVNVTPAMEDQMKAEEWEIDKASSEMAREYAACGFYPKEEFEILLYTQSLMKELDKVVDKCHVDPNAVLTFEEKSANRAQCGQYIFSRLDTNKSKDLDFEEVMEAVFKAFMARDLIGECVAGRVYRKQVKDYVLTLSNDLIGALDKNNDLKLTPDELSGLDDFMKGVDSERISTIYRDLQSYYPFLSKPISSEWKNLKHKQ